MSVPSGMKKTVGCFTEEKLRELAEQPNVTVMQPTHDIVYTPWESQRVMNAFKRVVQLTRRGDSPERIRKDPELDEFASKYTTFFSKLTDPAFAADDEHLLVMQKLILLRQMVEVGRLTEVEAQAQSADIALQSLAARAKKQ